MSLSWYLGASWVRPTPVFCRPDNFNDVVPGLDELGIEVSHGGNHRVHQAAGKGNVPITKNGKLPSKARATFPPQARARQHSRGQGPIRARFHHRQGPGPFKGKGNVPSKARARSHQRQGQGPTTGKVKQRQLLWKAFSNEALRPEAVALHMQNSAMNLP
ncbi:MAG: hypothetical protein FRX49_01327 [Trebouxia sp. A1-2]|nr:MAG: hypothetical protein FRX49_01327 [Trebouxia sp. A1-2]